MRHPLLACAALLSATLAGCSVHPPANWARGGSPLDLPRARWERGDHAVDLMPNGEVIVDGDHWFTVDRAGRVFEPDADPIALLEPDGHLVGTDEHSLGQVGLHNASLPGASAAWLTVDDRGEVIRYDDDGDRHQDGGWTGCGPALRTCTLVTHVVSIFEVRRRPHVGVGFGVGIGIGR